MKVFLRIKRAYPIDYYWIWGHEGEIDQKRFIRNLLCAEATRPQDAGLARSGWGSAAGVDHRQLPGGMDKALPKSVAFSVNMATGHAPVSPNFQRLEGHRSGPFPGSRTTALGVDPVAWGGCGRDRASTPAATAATT